MVEMQFYVCPPLPVLIAVSNGVLFLPRTDSPDATAFPDYIRMQGTVNCAHQVGNDGAPDNIPPHYSYPPTRITMVCCDRLRMPTKLATTARSDNLKRASSLSSPPPRFRPLPLPAAGPSAAAAGCCTKSDAMPSPALAACTMLTCRCPSRGHTPAVTRPHIPLKARCFKLSLHRNAATWGLSASR